MPIVDQEGFDNWEAINEDDPYGTCIMGVAREVMRMLDEDDGPIDDPHDLVNTADKNIKAGGITGFMAGAVAAVVTKHHTRGEEFRVAWNGEVGKHSGQQDSDGVLNPALMTVQPKQEGSQHEQT